jgi:hypothetical protein
MDDELELKIDEPADQEPVVRCEESPPIEPEESDEEPVDQLEGVADLAHHIMARMLQNAAHRAIEQGWEAGTKKKRDHKKRREEFRRKVSEMPPWKQADRLLNTAAGAAARHRRSPATGRLPMLDALVDLGEKSLREAQEIIRTLDEDALRELEACQGENVRAVCLADLKTKKERLVTDQISKAAM